MKIELKQRPKNAILIEGFPGFGLVGTIATEFLIKHLNAKLIGRIWSEELLPVAAVHESKVIEPLGIFYDKKYNLIFVHALSGVNGLEWELSEILLKLANDLKCKEIISLEGIGSDSTQARTFYYSTEEKKKKQFEKIGLIPLKEGIIMGVTGALLLRTKKISCIFVESHIGLADSKAAAEIVKVLDNYLGLKVDYKPLIKAAEQFEVKLKSIIQKSKEVSLQKDKKQLDYMG